MFTTVQASELGKKFQTPPSLNPPNVIARVDTTTICGTDLHILKGDVPEVEEGRILGHEAIGTITEVGSAVTDLKVGDRINYSGGHELRQVLIL